MLSGILFLYFFSMPVVGGRLFSYLESGYVRTSAEHAKSADAIVVLSGVRCGPIGPDKICEWGDPDRFFGALELFRARKAAFLIFTGAWMPWAPNAPLEGELSIAAATEMGIPAEAMLTTGKVSTTAEEAVEVAKLLRTLFPLQNARRTTILLVTSAYHMPRARRLFERAGLDVIPFAVDFKTGGEGRLTPMEFLPSAEALVLSERAVRELLGRAYYRLFQ